MLAGLATTTLVTSPARELAILGEYSVVGGSQSQAKSIIRGFV